MTALSQRTSFSGVTGNRRAKHGLGLGMRTAIRRRDANVAARTNVAATNSLPLSEREAAERFNATVLEFSAADLARAARRTKNAAKGWKDQSRCPNYASMVNIARSLPSVQAMILEDIGM